MRDRKAEPRRTNLKVFLSCRIVGMASVDRGLTAPLCDHSRCVGSPPKADVMLCPRVSFQDRPSRCDVPLCLRVSKLVPIDFIGFSLMARRSKISCRSSGPGVTRSRWESQNVASRYSPQRSPRSAGKASAPQVSSGPEKPAHAPEIRPSVAAAIPAYAAASLSSR